MAVKNGHGVVRCNDMTWRLTAEEDSDLRRLHALIRFANGTSPLRERYRRLRARDRRSEVREVRSDDVVHEVAIPYPAEPADRVRRAPTADRTFRHSDGAAD
jgi:hypothetical protein